MFERLLASRPAHRWPVSGGALSLVAHVAAAGVLLVGRAPSDDPPRAAPRPGAGRGEQVRWVAVAPTVGAPGATRPASAADGRRHPSAFFVPGQRRRPPAPADGGVPIPRLPVVDLPPLPDVFFPGFVASVPDLESRVTHPDDFVRPVRLAAHAVGGAPAVDAPYAAEDVERLPVPAADNPAPDYPDRLARERVGDTVVVQFEVDTTGAVDPRTVRLLRSTHALFAQAVRAVVPRFRFLPGQIGARAVRVVIQQPFLFRPLAARGS